MPIVVRDSHKRPRLVSIEHLAAMTDNQLYTYESYLRMCLTRLPDSPVLHSNLEAVLREVRYRAEDPDFH